MLRSIVCLAVVAVVPVCVVAARADEFGTAVDLTAFDGTAAEPSSTWGDIPLEEVRRNLGTAHRRFYLSGMIGPAFAAATSPTEPNLATTDTLFNAGGALGVAFERQRGSLRLEVEGMGRSTYDAPFTSPLVFGSTVLTNNWSVMTNLWRDLMITERFGVYGGGGIGAGGYILGQTLGGDTAYTSPAGNFAWQFGGGLLWQITDRLTFDVGYRYFQINTITQADYVQSNLFTSNELMFTLRLYEPFRGWRR
jgi:opacity protein-like surface antigen